MPNEKEILMNVYDKKFGKNYINFVVKNLLTEEVLNEGKCSNMSETRSIYKGLVDNYGENKVLLLQN